MSVMVAGPARRLDESRGVVRERREAIMREFAPFIKFLARRLAGRLPGSLDVEDLESAGAIGLMDAMEKYDASKGASLKTYAEIRIHGSMVDEIRSHDWVPRRMRHLETRIEQARDMLQSRHVRPPTQEEMAKELNIPTAALTEYETAMQGIVMLNVGDLISRGKDGQEIPRQLIDETEPDPLSSAITGNLRRFLGRIIDGLPKQERLVLALYYYEDLNMQEIAKILKLTLSRISQIHSKAIGELRTRLEAETAALV
jgi:RNA polymerase sigma factor for flagellar operon FliA